VTTNASANQKLGFFRADAALSVIFMSDEHEIGYPFPDPQAPGLPPRCDAKFEDGIKKDYYDKKGINLDLTFNAVKALKGDRPVKTHAFVNITKDDLFKRNSKNASCLYDSLGYGYFEMVAKTKGVLFSIQDNKVDGLARCGKVIRESLEIVHDFTLSKTADKVDPATIMAAVDAALVSYTYNASNNSVHLDNAGEANSNIEIRHCEPAGQVEWTLAGFTGTPAQHSVGLSWKTAEYATSGKILWGTDANSLSNTVNEAGVNTNHSVTVDGLDSNTVYYFKAVSTDDSGRVKSSDVLSFRTLPDWTIAGFSGQTARTSASLSWQTADYPTKGFIVWGMDPSALSNQSAETPVTNDHQLDITGLTPDTVYFFQAVSRDELGLEKRSNVISLRTQSDWGVAGFAGVATRTTVALSWATADEVTSGKVLWGTSANALSHQVNEGASGNDHSVTVTGLTPDTDYYFQAVSKDSQNNEKRSLVIMVHTAADWVIAGFAGTSTQTEVVLGWTTAGYSTDGKVFWGTTDTNLNNVQADSVVGEAHGATVTGLNPDTVYYFQAASVDSDGIEKRSEVVAIRTQQIPLPTWEIGNFSGTSTINSATLTWDTSQYATSGKILWGTDANNLSNAVNEVGTGTSHSVTVNGLASDTLYYFQAVSTDDLGQVKSSSVITVRTMIDPVQNPPANWVIVSFDGTTTTTQANLIWQTPGAQTKATIKVGLAADDLTLMSVAVDNFAETHLVAIPGLTPDTVYYFQVIAADSNGRTVESAVITKRTKAP
jgi:hypothetical protein